MDSCKIENPLLPSMDWNCSSTMVSTKLYKKRWLMLALFLLFGIANSIQYAQYTVVTNLMASYYDVSDLDVAMSTLIYMATYVVFTFPGVYVLEKLGIRKTLILSTVGMSAGAWIKVIAVKSTLYWFAFTGQTLVSIFQVFVLSAPPKLAALWFGDKEVATACGIGLAGSQFGIAMGFLFTPLLIHQGTTAIIEEGLYENLISTALFCTIVAIAIFFFYEELPPKPPSLAQLKAAESRIMKKSTFREAAKNLISNKSFVLFVIVFGVNLGTLIVYSVYINELTLHYYPNASVSDVGFLGVLTEAFLIIGILLGGIVLDNFSNYRLLILFAFVLNISAFSLFCTFYEDGMWLFKLLIALLGFAIGIIFSLGYEVGVEITYPGPEEISGGFLSCSFQLFGIIFACLYYLLFKTFGFACANFTLVGAVLIVDILLFFIDFDLRRQAVINNNKYNEL